MSATLEGETNGERMCLKCFSLCDERNRHGRNLEEVQN